MATPNVSYFYDNLPNAKGKLIKVSSSVSTTEYTSFDILGRVTASKQTTDGVTYGSGTTDSLSGALIEQQYPSGRVVKNTLDNDGDLSIVQSKKNASSGYWSYASSFTYNAAGAVTSMQLGNGKWESTTFNSRLQPTQIALGATPTATNLLKLNYSYGDWNGGSIDATKNNGNIVQQIITVPTVGVNNGFTATQKYYYDSLNRIDDATEDISGQTWRQDFTYDRYGNRNFQEANTTTLPKNCGTSPNFTVCTSEVPIVNPAAIATTNKLTGYIYDSSGNTTQDAELRKFTYDGENKQVKVETVNSGGTVTGTVGEYIYDGDGKRIKKKGYTNNVLTEETIFVYDASGRLVAEYSPDIASVNDARVAYLTNDHLGSPRINTDQNGAVIARHDYHPFGEEIIGIGGRTTGLGYAADDVRKQFTGYERDNETELDFAQSRYMHYTVGRFSTPDSFTNDTRVSSPQSWNLYSYVRNNPLNITDPFGKKGEIRWWTDSKGTIHVRLKASFAVYGAKGQGVSKADLKAYKNALVDGIKTHLEKAVKGAGKSFEFTVDISAKTYSSEQKAIGSGRDNVVEIGYGQLEEIKTGSPAAGAGFGVKGENFDRMVLAVDADPASNRGSLDPIESAGAAAAHEFAAHLLSGGHNENANEFESIFAGEMGPSGSQFYASDATRLLMGVAVDSNLNYVVPAPPGSQPSRPLERLSPRGNVSRMANSRDNSSPADVVVWKTGVKR